MRSSARGRVTRGSVAVQRTDRARHVAQADVLVQERWRGAQGDEVRERVGTPPLRRAARRHDAGAVQRTQPSRREVQQPRDLALW